MELRPRRAPAIACLGVILGLGSVLVVYAESDVTESHTGQCREKRFESIDDDFATQVQLGPENGSALEAVGVLEAVYPRLKGREYSSTGLASYRDASSPSVLMNDVSRFVETPEAFVAGVLKESVLVCGDHIFLTNLQVKKGSVQITLSGYIYQILNADLSWDNKGEEAIYFNKCEESVSSIPQYKTESLATQINTGVIAEASAKFSGEASRSVYFEFQASSAGPASNGGVVLKNKEPHIFDWRHEGRGHHFKLLSIDMLQTEDGWTGNAPLRKSWWQTFIGIKPDCQQAAAAFGDRFSVENAILDSSKTKRERLLSVQEFLDERINNRILWCEADETSYGIRTLFVVYPAGRGHSIHQLINPVYYDASSDKPDQALASFSTRRLPFYARFGSLDETRTTYFNGDSLTELDRCGLNICDNGISSVQESNGVTATVWLPMSGIEGGLSSSLLRRSVFIADGQAEMYDDSIFDGSYSKDSGTKFLLRNGKWFVGSFPSPVSDERLPIPLENWPLPVHGQSCMTLSQQFPLKYSH